jgi:hypothetical protein
MHQPQPYFIKLATLFKVCCLLTLLSVGPLRAQPSRSSTDLPSGAGNDTSPIFREVFPADSAPAGRPGIDNPPAAPSVLENPDGPSPLIRMGEGSFPTIAAPPASAMPSGSFLVPSQITPGSAIPHPPLVDNRPPIPIPPNVTLPPLANARPGKAPLSWRTKAYAMANEKVPVSAAGKFSWSLAIPFDKSRLLLTSALNQTGFQVQSCYEAAGHYLVTPTDPSNSVQIIIVAQPLNSSLTAFQLRVFPDARRKDVRRIEDLPQVMNTLLGSRGLL